MSKHLNFLSISCGNIVWKIQIISQPCSLSHSHQFKSHLQFMTPITHFCSICCRFSTHFGQKCEMLKKGKVSGCSFAPPDTRGTHTFTCFHDIDIKSKQSKKGKCNACMQHSRDFHSNMSIVFIDENTQV